MVQKCYFFVMEANKFYCQANFVQKELAILTLNSKEVYLVGEEGLKRMRILCFNADHRKLNVGNSILILSLDQYEGQKIVSFQKINIKGIEQNTLMLNNE